MMVFENSSTVSRLARFNAPTTLAVRFTLRQMHVNLKPEQHVLTFMAAHGCNRKLFKAEPI
jgi:hypothetical protein